MPGKLSHYKETHWYPSITVHISEWMLKEIAKKNDNRSEYIREAVKEYLNEMYPYYHGKEEGATIITYALGQDIDLEDMNKLCLLKKEISRSELTRNAIRRKLLLDEIQEKKKEEEANLPEGYIIVPGYNGNRPIKTRRLE